MIKSLFFTILKLVVFSIYNSSRCGIVKLLDNASNTNEDMKRHGSKLVLTSVEVKMQFYV